MNLFVIECVHLCIHDLLMCGLHYHYLKPYMRPRGECEVGCIEHTISGHLLDIEVNTYVVYDLRA